MFNAIEKINAELLVAQAQLLASRKAKAAAGDSSNAELLALIERVEYFRGRVDMAALLHMKLVKSMRQEASEDAWRRRERVHG